MTDITKGIRPTLPDPKTLGPTMSWKYEAAGTCERLGDVLRAAGHVELAEWLDDLARATDSSGGKP